MKFLKGLVVFILLLILLIVGVGGYFGLIPGVSKLFGTDKPKDLGVRYTQANYDTAGEKTGSTLAQMPTNMKTASSVAYEGSHHVDIVLTQEEITSRMNMRRWKDIPFKQVQIKFSADGTIEASGIMSLPVMTNYFAAMGINTADVKAQADKFHVPMADVPFYIKGKGEGTNNHFVPDVSAIEIGRVPVPSSIIQQYQQPAADLATHLLSQCGDFSMEQVNIQDSKLHFKGTLVDKEYFQE